MAILSLLQKATASLWPTSEPDDDGQAEEVRLSAHEPRSDLQYCLDLDKQCGLLGSPTELSHSWKSLERDMALTPAGAIRLMTSVPVRRSGQMELAAGLAPPTHVEPVYVDRHTVTNAEYWAFVESGAYSNVDNWPAEMLPYVLQFMDKTSAPGPKYWEEGRPPSHLLNHPVVGISWYEANAYAKWVGKRLLTSEEWQRAGVWPAGNGGERRYPWGDAFERNRANIWASSVKSTVAVDDYYNGCTPNGVYQLIGNVWEWLVSDFQCDAAPESLMITFDQPMAEIRGGAFDTYFETQATCQFRTGKTKLFRGNNVGFRCCVSASQLQQPPSALDLLDSDLPEDE